MNIDKKILTMEDANSVLQHFTRGFIDYYTLDTRNLTTEDNLFSYDFVDIYRIEDNLKFSIANEFWTKGFLIKDCNIDDYSVDASGNEIEVTGTGLEWVVLCLEMSSSFKHANPLELEYIIEYAGRIRPFYQTHQMIFKCMNNDQPVAGKVFTNPSTGTTYTSNSNGVVSINVGPAKPGQRVLELTTSHNGTTTTYKFPFIYIKSKFPVTILNNEIIKEKENRLNFKFLHNTNPFLEEDMFFDGNHIQLKTGNNSYSLSGFWNNEMEFNIPVNNADKLNMELYVEGNEYIDRYSQFFEVDTSYATFEDTMALKHELESYDCAKTVLYTGDELEYPITVDKDVHIIFDGDVTSELEKVFDVNNGAKLSISNMIYTGKNLINVIKGNVALKNNNFIHCTDKIIKGSGNLNIDNCGFIDNNSCVDINGNVNIKNSTFDLSDEEYVDTSLVPFISVYGNLDFDYSDFNIDLYGLDELGYSYVALKIAGSDFQTNGINNNLLKKNDQFKMLNNKGSIHVETDNYKVSSKNNKAISWNPVNTNTVFNNYLKIEYIGD